MVKLTVTYGKCPITCVGFGFYAMLLCSGGTNINEGYRYGRLSLEMYDEFKNEAWLCRVSAAFYGCICTWKEPVSKTIKPLDHAYRVGLGTGDIEFAVVSKYNLVRTFLFFSFLTSSAIALCEYELLE
jgi:predicted ATPase